MSRGLGIPAEHNGPSNPEPWLRGDRCALNGMMHTPPRNQDCKEQIKWPPSGDRVPHWLLLRVPRSAKTLGVRGKSWHSVQEVRRRRRGDFIFSLSSYSQFYSLSCHERASCPRHVLPIYSLPKATPDAPKRHFYIFASPLAHPHFSPEDYPISGLTLFHPDRDCPHRLPIQHRSHVCPESPTRYCRVSAE